MAEENSPVLVTGGSGFLGSHCVTLLLDRGFTVRTTVRSIADDAKTGYLKKLAADGAKLELVEADLLGSDDQWEAAMEGCKSLLHVASPFYFSNKTEAELIEPAVKGTEGAIKAAIKSGTVKHVVLTSSVAAVRYTGDNTSTEPLTESDWSTLEACPGAYPRSKTLAERAAWDLVNGAETDMDLATICPSLILGPPLIPGNSTSVGTVLSMMNGSLESVADIWFGIVDVRDVAKAHVAALLSADAGGNRFIVNARTRHFNEIADIVRAEIEPLGYKTPPNCTIKEKKPRETSGAKAQEQLGITYTSFEDTVRKTVHKLIELGAVQPPTGSG